MTIAMPFVVNGGAVKPSLSESRLLQVKAVELSENEEREWACDPKRGPFTIECSWDQVSAQDNVPFTILTGQFGWHILGISADSMAATCTPSTNPHLQLQMVHNFFSSVYNSSWGWGWGERRFCSQASPVRWALSPTEPQCLQKTNSQGHTYSVLANHIPGILLWICTNATS